MGPLIETAGLEKSYPQAGGDLRVLKGIDLAIDRGEKIAVVGPSGAGKSTLLHILGGLDRPTAGSLSFEGEPIFDMSDHELARFRNRAVGFVFQFHHLMGEFTALENVSMPLRIMGEARDAAERRAAEVLDMVGLSERFTHRPSELSGGEQQRVAMARALAPSPAMILADEPTGNLDHETGDSVHRLLDKLNSEEGITVVVVTHNPVLAKMADRVVTLENGLITKEERT